MCSQYIYDVNVSFPSMRKVKGKRKTMQVKIFKLFPVTQPICCSLTRFYRRFITGNDCCNSYVGIKWHPNGHWSLYKWQKLCAILGKNWLQAKRSTKQQMVRISSIISLFIYLAKCVLGFESLTQCNGESQRCFLREWWACLRPLLEALLNQLATTTHVRRFQELRLLHNMLLTGRPI